MVYSLSSIMNTQIKLEKDKIYPLKKYRSINQLDLMTIEEFLFKYNKDLDKFTLKQLVAKLENNCTIFGPGKLSKGEAQVNSSYIYEVIARHFTESKGHDEDDIELDSDIRAVDNNRKYLIYFAVDNRDIPGYFDTKKRRVKYRRKKLQKRYTYSNPLNRIHGFTVLDDDPCLCKNKLQKYLSIKIICANPFASKANIKAVGSYLLMFVMCLGYKYHFHKLILEVTNSEAADILGEEYDEDSDSEEEDDDDDEEEDDDDDEEEEEESDSDEENDDDDDDEDQDDDEEDDDDDEDQDDEDNECCDIAINNNIKCNTEDDEYDSDDSTIDKFDYVERIDELDQLYGKKDLLELCECYDIDFRKKDSKTELIYKIVKFEFWNFEEHEDEHADTDCESDWITKGDDDLEYGGKRYLEGKNETKSLYCNFYEKHGFRENPDLNTEEKCFSMDPLPSMEIILEENNLEDLLAVFFKRKYYKQGSDFCGKIPDDKILIKD